MRNAAALNFSAFQSKYYEVLEFLSYLVAKEVEGSFIRQMCNMGGCGKQCA